MKYASTSSRHQHERFATVAKVTAVRADYVAGRPYAEIMARHQVSEGAITFWRRKYGWPPRHPSRAAHSEPENRGLRWICYCVGEGGVVNLEPKCSKCGTVPGWAKDVA